MKTNMIYIVTFIELSYDYVENCKTFVYSDKILAQEECDRLNHVGDAFIQEVELPNDLNVGHPTLQEFYSLTYYIRIKEITIAKYYSISGIPKNYIPTIRTDGHLISDFIRIHAKTELKCRKQLTDTLNKLEEESGGIVVLNDYFKQKEHDSTDYKFDFSTGKITITEKHITLKPEYRSGKDFDFIPSGCPNMIDETIEVTEL